MRSEAKNSPLLCVAAGLRIALYKNIYYTLKQAALIKVTFIKTSCLNKIFSMSASQTKERIK